MAPLENIDAQSTPRQPPQPPAGPFRLVAIDLDGTLLRGDGTMGERTQRALRAAAQRGVKVVICTGRRFRTTLPILEQLDLAVPVIVHGGQLIKDTKTFETLHHHYLPRDLAREVLIFLKAHNITPIVYVDLFAEGTDIFVDNDRDGHRFHRLYLERNRLHCRFVGDVTRVFCPQTIHVGALAERSPLEELNVRLEQAFGEAIRHLVMNNTNDEGAFLEIMTPGNSKWRALSRLMQMEGIAPDQVICIGDEINDLEMIRHAGLGVAMGNAIPAIKAVADYITRSNEEDGVAHAVEQFVLKETQDDASRTDRS
ncbi:MAG TPA: Cof-type HAD-IIB family hydrolase [Alphaproteobacteria bacterium]|nr:Cof-type HAD-IIB family hydrolase [Alphaproteobacteria bacterium]